MKTNKAIVLLIIVTICLIGNISLVYGTNSSDIYKFKPKYLTTDFNFEMMGTTVTQDDHTFSSVGNFRTNKDLVGMTWETEDTLSHRDLKYPTDADFSGVILEYEYSISGCTELMNSGTSPVITIETNSGDIYYVRLWNYVVDRPLDDWEVGASDYYETTIRFPEGRNSGNANGQIGSVVLDFDNLYAGWSPFYWQSTCIGEDEFENPIYSDEWLPSPDWEKVPVNDIKTIMWSFVPQGYNWKNDQMTYLDDSFEYRISFSNWNVFGNTYLRSEQPKQQTQDLRLCDDYDDIYNLTPERVISEYDKLGYGEIVNFYIGASHFYDKRYNGHQMEMITDYPFNLAFESWYKDYIKRISERNMDIIHSVSMESVDAPEEWWQRAWDGTPGSTMWQPTPHLLSFTNPDLKLFYKKYVEELGRLSSDEGLKPIIQLGEPWWWFIEINDSQPPCFYDQATKDLFYSEKGYPMHEFKSSHESIEGHEEVLQWLREQNGKFAHFLRDTIKQKYPNSEFTVLFFTPSVIDKDRVPEIMSIVNFPQEYWQYPNLDFFMIEDYDYLIFDQMDKHLETLTFSQNYLGYPEDKVHYFSGFVLNSDYSYVWENIEQAINNGFNQGFEEVYLWAYTQIKRGGWVPPDIIYAKDQDFVSYPPGTYDNLFSVSLFSNGAEDIIYTIDGSEPSLTNGTVFSEPIDINYSTLIRAVAVKNNNVGNIVEFDYNLPNSTIPVEIIVDGDASEWLGIAKITEGNENIASVYSIQDVSKLYLMVRGTNLNVSSNFYIDIDNDAQTGYQLWCWNNSGADYMIENDTIKQYTGNGSDWNWTTVGNADVVKNNSVIEASINHDLIGLTEPTVLSLGYGRDYTDFAPIPGKDMALSDVIGQGTVNLDSIGYTSIPLRAQDNESLGITLRGNNTTTTRNYYVEVICSWDNITWWSKGGKTISINAGTTTASSNITYNINFSGDLYTKVIVYDRQGGIKLLEELKDTTDPVEKEAARVGAITIDYNMESNHNYLNNEFKTKQANFPLASGIRVHFVYIQTEQGSDFVETDAGDQWTGTHYDVWSSWKEDSKIDVLLMSDESNTDLGYNIDKIEYIPGNPYSQKIYELQSPHNYDNNYNNTWTLTYPGANRVRVRFSKIQTQQNCDFVSTSTGNVWSGSHTDVWSNWTTGDSINITLSTDGSVTDWGFDIDAIEIE